MSMCIYTQAYDGYIYLMDKAYLLTMLIELESCQILENMSWRRRFAQVSFIRLS